MAVVIACVNHKGGCSRTTTAVNLASSLAMGSEDYGIRSRKVLLVDMDPKGNVATTFGVDKSALLAARLRVAEDAQRPRAPRDEGYLRQRRR